jgi:Fe-S-cluster containining protein
LIEMDADLAALCQSCGLCCDGSLFGFVPLDREEAALAHRHRLRILENGKGFEQPCVALSERDAPSGPGRVCSLYEDRPRACRSFACRLYERHRRDGGPLEARLAAARRVRELVAELEAEGLTPADFAGDPESPSYPSARAMRVHAELQKRLEEDFARA